MVLCMMYEVSGGGDGFCFEFSGFGVFVLSIIFGLYMVSSFHGSANRVFLVCCFFKGHVV